MSDQYTRSRFFSDAFLELAEEDRLAAEEARLVRIDELAVELDRLEARLKTLLPDSWRYEVEKLRFHRALQEYKELSGLDTSVKQFL